MLPVSFFSKNDFMNSFVNPRKKIFKIIKLCMFIIFIFSDSQNEPGIQEVWDTVRTVRCLWEGNINKALTVSLSVDMLNQEIVTFSGDTATAKLDIQVGKGPFAPAANGLVKIGDTMTLVVSVEGDPGFDLQVQFSLILNLYLNIFSR